MNSCKRPIINFLRGFQRGIYEAEKSVHVENVLFSPYLV